MVEASTADRRMACEVARVFQGRPEVSRFLWDQPPQTLRLPRKTVAWLQAIPISTAEPEYARANGSEALEDLLEQQKADAVGLLRESVL